MRAVVQRVVAISTGVFQAIMEVDLEIDGSITLMIDSKKNLRPPLKGISRGALKN